jgi:hypothetical protein
MSYRPEIIFFVNRQTPQKAMTGVTPPRRHHTSGSPLPPPPSSSDDSWRTLTPPPKTNAIPKTLFEAQIFHRMVDHLQEEEQWNQSFQRSTTTEAQEMDDSLSLTEPNHPPDESLVELLPAGVSTTTTTTPPRNTNNNNGDDDLRQIEFASSEEKHECKRKEENGSDICDDDMKDDDDDDDASLRNAILTMDDEPHHEEANEAELAVIRDDDKEDDDEEEDSCEAEDNDTAAASWEWSLHHPHISKFPDIGPRVGSSEITMLHLAHQTTQKTSPPPPDSSAWNVWGNNRIRLVHLEPMGRMISGRIHSGTMDDILMDG